MDAKLHPAVSPTARAPHAGAPYRGTPRDAPLRMDPEEFRRVTHGLVDPLAAFLDSMPNRPVTTGEPPQVIQELVGGAASLPDEGADADALLERIQSWGEAFVSNAVIGERYVLRACIVNFNTTLADVEALPEIVAGLGRETDAALRSEIRPRS